MLDWFDEIEESEVLTYCDYCGCEIYEYEDYHDMGLGITMCEDCYAESKRMKL